MCVICDKEYHGQCNDREQCVNCGKKHKSSDRNGEKYQKRLVMNQIKATKGITSYEARTIIDSATEKKDAGKESNIRRGIENIEIKP